MAKDFSSMRSLFKARYVRIYSVCEGNNQFYDDVVAAAYQSGIGVYAMVWFGCAFHALCMRAWLTIRSRSFNGPQDLSWEGRLNGLINTITVRRIVLLCQADSRAAPQHNRLASYVIRSVTVRPSLPFMRMPDDGPPCRSDLRRSSTA